MTIEVHRRPVVTPVERIEITCCWRSQDTLKIFDFQNTSCVIQARQNKSTTGKTHDVSLRLSKDDAKVLAEALLE